MALAQLPAINRLPDTIKEDLPTLAKNSTFTQIGFPSFGNLPGQARALKDQATAQLPALKVLGMQYANKKIQKIPLLVIPETHATIGVPFSDRLLNASVSGVIDIPKRDFHLTVGVKVSPSLATNPSVVKFNGAASTLSLVTVSYTHLTLPTKA